MSTWEKLAYYLAAALCFGAAAFVPSAEATYGLLSVGGLLAGIPINPRATAGAVALIAALSMPVVQGCALAPSLVDGMAAILPKAVEAFRKEAERQDTDIDANQAICYPLPEEYQPEGQLLVMCAADTRE